MKTRTHRQSGLSLFEVILVVATVALLASIFLPRLMRSKRSSRIGCTGNLKQVGLSYRLFANDHQDKFPFAVSKGDGGTLEFVKTSQVFRHFEAMSNELVTPKILICPQDLKRRAPNPNNDGVVNFQNLSNTNLSYFVGLDAKENDPQQILSGDRNITGGTLSNGFLRTLRPTTRAGWTSDIHHNAGNVGLSDGSVQQLAPKGLSKHLVAMTNATIRLAIP